MLLVILYAPIIFYYLLLTIQIKNSQAMYTMATKTCQWIMSCLCGKWHSMDVKGNSYWKGYQEVSSTTVGWDQVLSSWFLKIALYTCVLLILFPSKRRWLHSDYPNIKGFTFPKGKAYCKILSPKPYPVLFGKVLLAQVHTSQQPISAVQIIIPVPDNCSILSVSLHLVDP